MPIWLTARAQHNEVDAKLDVNALLVAVSAHGRARQSQSLGAAKLGTASSKYVLHVLQLLHKQASKSRRSRTSPQAAADTRASSSRQAVQRNPKQQEKTRQRGHERASESWGGVVEVQVHFSSEVCYDKYWRSLGRADSCEVPVAAALLVVSRRRRWWWCCWSCLCVRYRHSYGRFGVCVFGSSEVSLVLAGLARISIRSVRACVDRSIRLSVSPRWRR